MEVRDSCISLCDNDPMIDQRQLIFLSVLIPCFNEEKTIESILERVHAVEVSKEIIVVDDGSTDRTPAILDAVAQRIPLKILKHNENKGKGSAIRTGLKFAQGDVILIQDADLEYDPRDYPVLLEPFLSANASVVFGSRNLNPGNGRSSFSFYWGGRFLSGMSNVLYGTRITDEATCYKAFRKGVLESLNLVCEKFEFCPEVTAKLARKGIRITEVPVRYSPRNKSEGKKIGWRDGAQAIWILLKYRFVD